LVIVLGFWDDVARFFLNMTQKREKFPGAHPADQVMKSTPVFLVMDGIGVNFR
jgi:hypothetical protein